MKTPVYIFFCLLLASKLLVSQTTAFKENSKWGIKENEKIIVAPVYDTVVNFDELGKVCIACYKTKTASANRFIKMVTTAYSCKYLDKENKHLIVKTAANDTCSVFTMGKSSVKLFTNDNKNLFTVSIKNKKYLVDKDFRQLTFNGYYAIEPSADPNYYVVQEMNEGGVVLTGLVNLKEEQVIAYSYSNIKINPNDSLIVGCSAGVRTNSNDDVFNYAGKKTDSYRRHIDIATKNFIVHKIFEPKEYYIIYNISTKEEKNLNADEIQPSIHDEILMRVKNDWFLYDLNSNQKKPFKHS